MDIQMIAMDMDGTLLRSDNTISNRTKQALREAQQKGIKLVLASGRSYRKLLEYAKELEMDRYGGYLIEVNGTALYDVKHEKREVFHQLSHDQMLELFELLKPFEVEILGMGDDSIYDYIPASLMEAKYAYIQEHQLGENHPLTAGAFGLVSDNRVGYPIQVAIENGTQFPASLNKLAVAHIPDVLAEKVPMIKAQLESSYWLGLTSPGWLEIMPKGVTKASGLHRLCEQLQIPLSQVMAFGDGENDIEMLQAVGCGVAMENALENVVQFADATCPSNNHDGIAVMVEKMILSK